MPDPKRLLVRNRFITVMELIRTEDGYFYKPDLVTKKIIDFYDGPGNIKLTAYPDEGGEIVEHTAEVDETFFMMVHCIVQNFDDPHEVAERVLQDVRMAIDVDSRNPNTGYLGGMTLQTVMKESADMLTEHSVAGQVEWMQRFEVMIVGDNYQGL